MDDEYTILRGRLNSIIKEKSPQDESRGKYQLLLNELDRLKNDSVSVRKNTFFSRLLSSIRSRYVRVEEKEFDREKYEDIKKTAIKLYSDDILKRDYPATIGPAYKNMDAAFRVSFSIDPSQKLLMNLNKFTIVRKRLRRNGNGEIEVFPWTVKPDEIEDTVSKEYLKISEKFLTNPVDDVEKVFEETAEDYSKRNEGLKKQFFEHNLAPYYGDPQFICERSQYILECMDTLLADKEVKEENKTATRELIEEARELVSSIEECKEKLSNKEDDEIYEKLRTCYRKLLSFEDVISNDVEKIWNDFLTKPEEYKEGERFAFLVHTFTKGVVRADVMNKCCCTLVTDKCLPIPYGDVGVICGFKKENIGSMCTEDAGSWVINKEKFYDREIPVGWQFAEYAGTDKDKVFYEYPRVSKLILPTTMEREMIEKNIETRKNIGSKFDYRGYTEIFMVKGKNGEKIPIQELFYTDNKGKEKAKKIKGDFNPIFLDPSSGTEVPFDDDKHNENNRD